MLLIRSRVSDPNSITYSHPFEENKWELLSFVRGDWKSSSHRERGINSNHCIAGGPFAHSDRFASTNSGTCGSLKMFTSSMKVRGRGSFSSQSRPTRSRSCLLGRANRTRIIALVNRQRGEAASNPRLETIATMPEQFIILSRCQSSIPPPPPPRRDRARGRPARRTIKCYYLSRCR